MNVFLVYLLKTALLTAVFVLLYHMLLKRDTFHRTARIVLVSSLIISYLLPLCVITIHKPVPVVKNLEPAAIQAPVAANVAASRRAFQPDVQQGESQIRQEQDQINESAVTQVLPKHEVQQAVVLTDSNRTLPVPVHMHIDWVWVLMIIYALGVVSLLAFRLLSAFKVMGFIRRGRVVKEMNGYKIVVSSEKINPFNWMNYIVLPQEYPDPSCASAVIRHEYSHVSHHHSIELLAVDILSAFQWFNPAVWVLRHDLCCVQEFQADASVLESGFGKLEYEQSLLSIATGGMSMPLVNGLGESYLLTRIRMMNRNISRKGNLFKLIYLPVVIVIALILTSQTIYDKSETDNTEIEADVYPEHDFIDLGLSVNWATCNLGSSYPDYRGTLFELGMEYQGDTATALWGKDWRMPTKEELQELMDSCSWEFEKNRQGFLVTGRNGNSIFLPAGGFKSGDRDYLNYGSGVYLWGSRDLESPEEPRAWMLSALSGPHAGKRLDLGRLSLLVSRSIRPVTEQPYIPIQGIGLNRKRIKLEIGREYKLNASFIPSDATRKRIFWHSGNSAVAKVDAHGKVTAVSDGECTIWSVCGDFKAECQVTVKMPKGYAPPKQQEAVTIFRFGEEVNKTLIEDLEDFDDTLKLKEVFRTNVGDKAKGFQVIISDFTDGELREEPGEFCLVTVETGGEQYRFKNMDWVTEPLFDNGYFHCVKVAESRYLLFLKGFDYGCCPGTLTVLAIDETGAYIVMSKEYHLREFNSRPFSMTVADWYDEYVSDDVTINSTTYTLFIEDGALKKRWVQLYPNQHEYVDLGLSVNWATCNVGADRPEEFGDYYAWGETAPYYIKNADTDNGNELRWREGKEAGYDWNSYFDIKTIEPTDYDPIVTFGHYNTLEKRVIEYYDDAATMNWGGEWRIPRQAEFEELINPDNCTWTWTTINGVNGYRVTSRIPGYEGNSIFLPAAGGLSDTEPWLKNAYGWYWSGSIYDKSSDKSTSSAYSLSFYFETRFIHMGSGVRSYGYSVRPVLPNGRGN